MKTNISFVATDDLSFFLYHTTLLYELKALSELKEKLLLYCTERIVQNGICLYLR
jgi:hypothetical protein